MADESINSSPRKLNSSIHESRLHRKHKRFNATYTKTTEPSCKHENEEEDLSCTLLVMYDSDETTEDSIKDKYLDSEKPISKVNISYDPFAECRLLVLADRSRATPCSSRNFKSTQGFEPSNNFLFKSPEQRVGEICKNNKSKTDSFEITDSELLQVCEETEKKAINLSSIKQENIDEYKSPTTLETKRETKSIVDIILEDFCGSSQSPERQQPSEEDHFNFRFANKPLRTYSRRKHESVMARQNIAEQYAKPNNSLGHCVINDDLLSNDSSTDLSVQEDQTHLIHVKEEVVVLQNSQSLCENLQNLSAYFTELSGERENNVEMRSLAEKISSDTVFTATKAKDDYTQIEEERRLLETKEQCRSSINGHMSNEEEFKGFSSEEDDSSVHLRLASKQNCDTLTPNDGNSNDDKQNDEWYDECDIFAKFDMGIALVAASSFELDKIETSEENHTLDTNGYNSAQKNVEPIIGFRTASNKEVKISTEAQARAASILQNLPPLPINSSCDEGLSMEDETAEDCQNVLNRTKTISKMTNDDFVDTAVNPEDVLNDSNIEGNELPNFGGFTTASHKTITISNEAKRQASHILEQLTPLPLDEICVMNDATSNNASTSKELFIGFRTASSKSINISKEAQESALKILEQLPENGIDANKLTGYHFASRKMIQISDDAKKRAARILEDMMDFQKENAEDDVKGSLENIQFSEWPLEVEDEVNVDEKVTNGNIANECKINLPGFSTTSKKAIILSEEAKQRAAVILESLPTLPGRENLKFENIKENSETKSLDNLIFPESPLGKVNEEVADKPESTLNGLNKRKRSVYESAKNELVSSSPPQTPKFSCKSISGERSPLAHIQTIASRSSFSELAVKTPPDYRARHGIIRRKNLLSLNKSNKLNAKSLQHIKEFKAGSRLITTPTKRSGTTTAAPIANEPKSPLATPIPNLQEFFSSATMSTSTPQSPIRQQTHMRTRARKRAELVAATLNAPTTTKAKSTITTLTNDTSFNLIDWENDSVNKSATSLNASGLSNSSCNNITKMESNPTPKQRIERLRMYGKPPSVSPICMSSTNNCRISGLKRRTRSASKGGDIDRE